jgi:hypothetical protein
MGISLKPHPKQWRDLLRQQQEALLKEDRFASPVAYSLQAAASAICQALANDAEPDWPSIEYAMKIKAVQGSDPLEGVAFIHRLKETVREKLSAFVSEEEWMKLESRINRIAADASEMFKANRARIGEMACRGPERRRDAGAPA